MWRPLSPINFSLSRVNCNHHQLLHVTYTFARNLQFVTNIVIVNQGPFQVDHKFEKVHSFKYLGVAVSSKIKEVEVQNRPNLANRCFYACNKLMSSKSLSQTIKIWIVKFLLFVIVLFYIAIISPILFYGAETWELNKKEERKLIVF
jgi:hypothetical protein